MATLITISSNDDASNQKLLSSFPEATIIDASIATIQDVKSVNFNNTVIVVNYDHVSIIVMHYINMIAPNSPSSAQEVQHSQASFTPGRSSVATSLPSPAQQTQQIHTPNKQGKPPVKGPLFSL